MDELKKLVQVCVERWRDDPSAPSVLLSYVNGKDWYISILRYHEPFGQGKQVVTKANGPELEPLVAQLLQLVGSLT